MDLAEKIRIIERIRDSKPSYNTLITLEDLEHFDMNILVFREDIPTEPVSNEDYMDIIKGKINDSGHTYIDTKFLEQTLKDKNDNSVLKSVKRKAKRNLEKFEKQHKDYSWNVKLQGKYQKLDENYETKKLEYNLFRPIVLTERIRKADLVVIPETLVDKVRAEIPEARIAILEDARKSDFELRKKATDENYPRVLARRYPSSTSIRDEPRIDYKTFDLLFKREVVREYAMDFLDSFYYGSEENMDSLFYEPLRRKKRMYINEILRETIVVEIPERILKGIFGQILPAEEIKVPVNYYGMGATQHGIMKGSNNFLEIFKNKKGKNIKETYEELWITPSDSYQEALDRQKLIANLVENEEQNETIGNLAECINNILEPYLHLSNMSKLISANILCSRWGSHIHKDEFFEDFTYIAKEFISKYETIRDSSSSISSDSREMEGLLIPLEIMMENNGYLDKMYRFLKKAASRKNFNEIDALFEKTLKESDAKKLKELEDYDPREDHTYPRKDDTFFSDGNSDINTDGINENLLKERFKKGLPIKGLPYRIRKSWQGDITLRGYKSPKLKELLSNFHSQNPITRYEDIIFSYLNYVGTKLTGYSLLAEFISEQGWTKTELLPSEEGIIEIKNGWYPLTNPFNQSEIVRNDTVLNPEERVEIIDGSNAAGKTIDTRKTFFITYVSLTTGHSPSEKARISFVERIRYRLKRTGMYDASALVEELEDIGDTLKALGAPILIGYDETFTSTNDSEGEAMTYGLVKLLAENKMTRAIITSHYPALHDILNDPTVDGVKFSHFEYRKEDGKLIFPYKKKNGPNKLGDYAIIVAINEKVPDSITNHAKKYLGAKE